jgi:hypothetical protein
VLAHSSSPKQHLYDEKEVPVNKEYVVSLLGYIGAAPSSGTTTLLIVAGVLFAVAAFTAIMGAFHRGEPYGWLGGITLFFGNIGMLLLALAFLVA